MMFLISRAEAQVVVSEITAYAKPAAIRPLETAVIQGQIYEVVANAEGKAERVRLQPGGVEFQIRDPVGGWLSKPFAHQGAPDGQRFHPRARPDFRGFFGGSTPDLGSQPLL